MRNSMRFALAVGLAIPTMSVQAQADAAAVADPSTDVQAAPAAPEAPIVAEAAPAVAAPEAEAEAAADEKAEPAAKSGSRFVEEVIVTAQKREEKLMSVPISIQAFSPEALDARGVRNTSDLMKVTPALDYGVQAGSFASVYIRGIGSEAWLTSDPSVATYVDGVYLPFGPSVAQDLGGIERVEILKGPQGTLFGRNANGGAINVVVKEPNFDDRQITVSANHSRAKDFILNRANIFANLPLSDTVAANVSAFFSTDDTYWSKDSTLAGNPIPNNKTVSARLKLRWLPTENSDIRFTVQGTKQDGTATAAAPIDQTTLGDVSFAVVPGPTRDVEKDARNYEIHPDLPIYGHLQSFVSNLTGIYNGDYFDTKLLGSFQDQSNPYNYDYDGTEFSGASFIVHKHIAKIQEAEINFLSNEGTPGADWLTVTAGAFYFRNTQGFDPVEVTVAGLNTANLNGIIAPQVQDLGIFQLLTGGGDGAGQAGLSDALAQALLNPIGGFLPSYALSNIGVTRTESWSVFLQTTAKLTDELSLTLGGRYQNERRGVLESNTELRIGQGFSPKVFTWDFARDASNNNAAFPLSHVTKGFKPKVALDYQITDRTLVYASYQEAVKAHSYNAFAFYLRPAYTPEESQEAYEVGVKTTLFEDTTRLTAAAWRYDLTNLQTQAISLINGGALSISTAGNARSQGFEFDMTSELFPSTFDSLVFSVNAAYIDAIYTKYENGQGHEETTGVFLPFGQNYSGNRITRTPKYTGSAALSKTWAVPGGPLEATVSTYYNDGFSYEASQNPTFSQPRYQTYGANISYLYDAQNLRFTLAGENLTDKFYTAGELLLDWGAMATLGPRRTVALRVDWTF